MSPLPDDPRCPRCGSQELYGAGCWDCDREALQDAKEFTKAEGIAEGERRMKAQIVAWLRSVDVASDAEADILGRLAKRIEGGACDE